MRDTTSHVSFRIHYAFIEHPVEGSCIGLAQNTPVLRMYAPEQDAQSPETLTAPKRRIDRPELQNRGCVVPLTADLDDELLERATLRG